MRLRIVSLALASVFMLGGAFYLGQSTAPSTAKANPYHHPQQRAKIDFNRSKRARLVARGKRRSVRFRTIAKDKAEKKILAILKDMRRRRWGMMNVPEKDGRLLRLLTEATNAKHVVEVGTSNGYSAIWFCLALRKTGGKLTTFEINKRVAKKARRNFKRAGVSHLVKVVLGDAHKKVKTLKGPIDIVFLDADKDGYVDYLKKLLPLVKPGGLILAHNTSMGVRGISRYLRTISRDPRLETLLVHSDFAGVGITLKKR